MRIAATALLSGLWAAVLPLASSARTIAWEPYSYLTRDSTRIDDCERGRLRVPENREADSNAEIELSFIRFRSTSPTPGPPIVWLAGGPGDFGSDDIEGPYLELVRSFQEIADVIALDQRGTGLSEPLLSCPETVIELPLDQPLDLDAYVDAHLEVARECAEYWTGRGVDLTAYNTVESAHDLADLRAALGAEKISIYGSSYGSHLGLATLRLHPEIVHRAVLSGVEGPDHTWKLPSIIEAHFAEVSRLYGGEEESGDLLATMHRVIARLDRDPVAVALAGADGDSITIVVGGTDIRLANRYFLGDLQNIRNLPAIYRAMDAGDFSILGRVARNFRSVSVGSAMYYCMDCASGASSERMTRIQEEGSRGPGLVGAALNAPFPRICDAWPHRDLGPGFRGPLRSEVPTLFVSGSLDGHTPPGNVEELIGGFSNGSHLVVENASHQYLELFPEAIQTMCDFLRGSSPNRQVVVRPAITFE